MRLSAVLTGQPAPVAAKSGQTGHFKRPRAGAVAVGPAGLEGDCIVDLEHHGGPDQAVYLFGDFDRAWWAEALGHPVEPGFFGENLAIAGLTAAALALGDVLQIGAARLQITAPRIPCATFAAVTGRKDALELFFASARPGAYARVLEGGRIEAGMKVTHLPFAGPRISVVEALEHVRAGRRSEDWARRVLRTPAHEKMRAEARAHLSI